MNYRAMACFDCRGLADELHRWTELSPARCADTANFPRSGLRCRPRRRRLSPISSGGRFSKTRTYKTLVKTALQQNYDLRDAVARVEAARANLGITRSNQFPQMGASGDVQFTRLSRDGSFALPRSFVSSRTAIGARHR